MKNKPLKLKRPIDISLQGEKIEMQKYFSVVVN